MIIITTAGVTSFVMFQAYKAIIKELAARMQTSYKIREEKLLAAFREFLQTSDSAGATLTEALNCYNKAMQDITDKHIDELEKMLKQ